MKKIIITAAIIIAMTIATTGTASAASDYDLAKDWKAKHCKSGHIEKVNTTAQGGYKGKAGKWTVKYPKKVKKGKKVKVYMVVKNGDVKAMICLGIVKGDKAKKAKKTAKKTAKKATSKPVKAATVKAEPAPTEAAPQVQEPAEEMQEATPEATPAEEIEPAPEIETCEHCEEPGKCVYWISNENRHMTPEEIDEFEYLESHYQNEAGEWVER